MSMHRRSRRGAAMIEFGFWIVLMTLMLSAIVDFSWYMARSEIIMRAARDGSRSGAVSSGNNAAVRGAAEGRANQVLSALGEGGCTVGATVGNNPLNARVVTTNVSCAFTPLIGMVPSLPPQIGYEFTMYSEYQ